MQLMPQIQPISRMARDHKALLTLIEEQPVFLTQRSTPVAVMMIEPSFTPQSLGSFVATLLIVGGVGAVNTSSASDTIQVPSIFLTRIWYVPAVKPVNEPD